jgi:hypothetical protein
MIIDAFDPGGTTGFARLQFKDSGLTILDALEFCTLEDFREYYFRIVSSAPNVDIIVAENFVIRANKATGLVGDKLEAPQYLGIIKYIAYTARVPIRLLSPSVKATLADHGGKGVDQALKTPGFYRDLKSEHKRDAVTLAIYHALTTISS